MGMNLRSCCHRCKEQVFHYRMEESRTILPFYKRHYECMKLHPNNVETLEDQIQEAPWMREGCGGYKYKETTSNPNLDDKDK